MFSFVAALIGRSGVIGVFFLMLIENLIPIIPSELILPMAGFAAARGALDPVGAAVASVFGSVVGGAAWYGFGRRVGLERLRRLPPRYARWVTLSPGEVDRAELWFRRWGGLAVCIGRSLPGVRGVICIPAGMAGMALPSFLAWSSLGALFWTLILMGAGAALQTRYEQVGHWLNPIANAFMIFALLSYAIRVLRYKRVTEA